MCVCPPLRAAPPSASRSFGARPLQSAGRPQTPKSRHPCRRVRGHSAYVRIRTNKSRTVETSLSVGNSTLKRRICLGATLKSSIFFQHGRAKDFSAHRATEELSQLERCKPQQNMMRRGALLDSQVVARQAYRSQHPRTATLLTMTPHHFWKALIAGIGWIPAKGKRPLRNHGDFHI